MSLMTASRSDQAGTIRRESPSNAGIPLPVGPIAERDLTWGAVAKLQRLGSVETIFSPTYVLLYSYHVTAPPSLGLSGHLARKMHCLIDANILQSIEMVKFSVGMMPRLSYRPSWLGLAESKDDQLGVGDLKAIISGVSRELNSGNNFDLWLHEADIQKMSFDAITAILRTSFSARKNLSFWGKFLEESISELNSRGISAPSLESLRVVASA